MVTFGAPGRNLKNGPGAWTIIFPVAFKHKLPRGSPPKRRANSKITTLAVMRRQKTRPWLAFTPWASLETDPESTRQNWPTGRQAGLAAKRDQMRCLCTKTASQAS